MSSRLPSLIIIGGMKCGTTSLYRYLNSIENVSSSKLKEPSFFDDINWGRGLDWYKAQFDDDSTYKFEASTIYSKYPAHSRIPERMHQVLPDVKLVYIVRSPIKRIKSQLTHNIKMGNIKPDYLHSDEFRRKDLPHYINCSKYYLQTSHYLEYFDLDQLHFVRTEDMAVDPKGLVEGILSFWGLEDAHLPESIFEKSYNMNDARGRRTNKQLHRVFSKMHQKGLIKNGHKLFEKPWKLPEEFESESFTDLCTRELETDIAKFKDLTGVHWD